MKSILVLGGTGMLGAPLTRRLAAGGYTVRVLTRDPAAARVRLGEAADAVELVRGDAADASAVRAAMSGCDVVHVGVGPPVDLLCARHAAEAAAEEGAERIGYVSGTTVTEAHRWFPMVAEKLDAEAVVRYSGVPWTIFHPTWPFEQLPRLARGGRPFLLGEIRRPWHWFAADDFAAMVTAAYARPEAAGKRLYIHGPEAMTLREALERYCAVVYPDAPPITVMRLWLATVIGVLRRNRMLRDAAALMRYFRRVGEVGDPTETNALVGAPATTLEAWAASGATAPDGLSAASSRTDPPETGSGG